ncbi:hypothetical protein M514_20082 [Trichuris suis]|uniref:Uncharacterized protein n=1 Tax=Trichuris suis TaxID=68888 RepID=A0A085NE88_9BILA|nr:hypothetical protein M513_07520 [Trichuris suis]KFD67784.1 hypothetical protein M514_07520 [Trichuris suis]KFD67787.1 hypothetical protein M514_20082 [Trichuris suis]
MAGSFFFADSKCKGPLNHRNFIRTSTNFDQHLNRQFDQMLALDDKGKKIAKEESCGSISCILHTRKDIRRNCHFGQVAPLEAPN